jgi:hypothetical protein
MTFLNKQALNLTNKQEIFAPVSPQRTFIEDELSERDEEHQSIQQMQQ